MTAHPDQSEGSLPRSHPGAAELPPPPKRVFVGSPYRSASLVSRQAQRLIPTVVQEDSGATGLSACLVVMLPGGISRPHLHAHSEMIVVCVEGYAATLVGPELEPHLHGPGEFIYIPEGVIHVAVNLSATTRLVAFEARTDPHLNKDVVLVDVDPAELERVTVDLRRRFVAGDLAVPGSWELPDPGIFRFQDHLVPWS